MSAVQQDSLLNGFWKCSNVMAIDRMGYTDHGPTHVKIVANLALKLLRILFKNGIEPSLVKNYDLDNNDSEVVVVLGSIFHDLGMIVQRNDHEKYSVLIALRFLDKFLKNVYSLEEQAIITSEVLHCVVSHERPNNPLTVEAGIVSIADALDMESGRARIPFEAGKIDIHSVSALSIQNVEIIEGGTKPITVKITMSDSAGIFQIDQLLKPRIESSGIYDLIHVIAEVSGSRDGCIVDKFEV
ncbi:MAG: HD domain-containing protein [Candidatus Bathyarchaeota archaeon]|jgi:metal-dependent HD superfamily phosphatase/phosphodiesterase